jgi:enoyl-CoA hydratase/carnithine racemase
MVNRALLKTSAYEKPIVAAVNGVCAGGGLELMLATDIRACVPGARFGLPEVKWAIYPFGGSTAKLIEQIGHVHAMKLLLTAELIDAEEAVRIGLVNTIVPADDLMRWALDTAATIAANSPVAVQAVKSHISAGIAERARAREAAEQAQGDAVRASADFTEGVAAFRAKRAPHYD